jgi:microcin C transport system substrate-binding protein
LDQHDFDVHWTAWGASRLRDPETMWYSKTAQQPATQNIAGVEDERIDELIEQQRLEQDGRLRDDILRKIDTRLGELMPYALLWGSSSHRLLYWNKFKTPKGVLDRYNDPEAAIVYWSFDQQKEANLREAQQNKTSLKAEPKVINFRP